jgi:hypothetical protein
MLPKNTFPTYQVNLISSGKEIEFRPFLVKEQKLLLMASESEDSKTVINSIKQTLKNCIITQDVNLDKLPMFDLEHLFLNLRARSVNEIVDLSYKCNNKIKDEKGEETTCLGLEKFTVNLLEIKPEILPNHNKKITLTDKLGIMMRYPTIELLSSIQADDTSDLIIQLIVDSVDYIFDGDEIYYSKDTSREELVEFIETLQQKDLDKIKEFFDTSPKIKKQLDFKCKKCGHEEKIVVEGINNFFV